MHHVSADYLRDRLAPLVQGQTWLSVDIDTLRERARDIGWLREVRVHREWPNALRFELEEQVPVARWNDDRLLNAQGEPFSFAPVTPPEGLPDLSGPEGSGLRCWLIMINWCRVLPTKGSTYASCGLRRGGPGAFSWMTVSG